MSTNQHQKWNNFLEKWPHSRVKQMTLEEYTKVKSRDSFTFYLENDLEDLGSIWGGSAFKFGIFNRDNKDPKENSSLIYSDDYAWYRKYGETQEEAFQNVKDIIVRIIEATKTNDHKSIDSIDLGNAYKWKIAFLYQDQESLSIVPIYKLDMLKKITDTSGKPLVSEMQHKIINEKPSDLDIFEYGEHLWTKYSTESSSPSKSFWTYAPGSDAGHWEEFYNEGIMAIGWDFLGNLEDYKNKDEIVQKLQEHYNTTSSKKNDASANFQFCNELKIGDVILVKKGRKEYVGYGVVTGEYEYQPEREIYHHVRKVNWTKKGSWVYDDPGAVKTLTNVTPYPEFVKGIIDLIHGKTCAYWIFQGNPKHYDVKGALQANKISSWSVKAHADKIKEGDKFILWVTGNKSGCYALGSVISEVHERVDSEDELEFYTGKRDNNPQTRVNIIIDHNYSNSPLSKESLLSLPQFKGFNGGNQGTNFSATKEQYQAILDLVNPQATAATKVNTMNPQNIILYGPPGTGKTYELLNQWIPKYQSAIQTSAAVKEEALRGFVSNATWWEVIAVVIDNLGGDNVQVKDIHDHKIFQMKASLSSNKNLKQSIWGSLQSHSPDTSTTVNTSKRIAPAIFDKNEDSTWKLLDNWKELAPQMADEIEAIQGKDSNSGNLIKRYEFVTFHQSYGYEEFIEGLRPETNEEGQISYEVKPGVFKQICNKAKLDPANRYAIFIDEINRGNMSKIFGELITLIETDKRVQYNAEGKKIDGDKGLELTLPYSGSSFGVPTNLDIIGTMNTADRSIALLDIALRRRFEFKELMPNSSVIEGVDGDGTIENGSINLKRLLDTINQRIKLLAGRELQIGHAFLCSVKNIKDLNECFANKIIPLLQEYFYGHWERIQLVLGDQDEQLKGELKKQSNEVCFVLRETLDELAVLGIDHDDYETQYDYYVNPNLYSHSLSTLAYTKIYQSLNEAQK